jgi:hypothetical protein
MLSISIFVLLRGPKVGDVNLALAHSEVLRLDVSVEIT